jgi:hypothetical protein
MLGVRAVLNWKPFGAFSIRVAFLSLFPKSCFFPSAIVIAPSVVQAGELPLAAVFAEIAPPPEAEVITTDAPALVTVKSAKTGASREGFGFIE